MSLPRRIAESPRTTKARAYVCIDVNGTVCWGLCDTDKRLVSAWAKHPKRRVARVEVVAIVRKAPRAKRRKRR
jgi:hypothetical protein